MSEQSPVFRDTTWWHTKLNMLWFATSWKWFILLGAVLPGQVQQHVPGGEKSAAWGIILSVGAVWACFGPVLFGSLSDRLGRRRPFVIIGTLLTAIGLLGLGWANSLVTIAAGFLFLQVADDVIQGAYSSLLPLLVPREHQGRSSAILAALNQGSQIVGAVAAMGITAFWGGEAKFGLNSLKATYVVMALANIICAGAVLSAIKNLKEPYAAKPGKIETTWSVVRDLRSSGDFMWVWFSRLLVTLGYWLIQPYLLYYLTDAFGRGEGENVMLTAFGKSIPASSSVYIVALLISLSAAVTAMMISRKLDKIGLKKFLYAAGWLMAVMLVPFAFIRDFSAILILAMMFGVGYGIYFAASWALAAEVMPSKENLGRDMGLWQSATTLPQITPLFTGIAVTALNGSVLMFKGPEGHGVFGYMAAIIVAAGLMITGCQMVRKVKGVH